MTREAGANVDVGEPKEIWLDALVEERRFQARRGLNSATVRQYARAYEADADFPPVRVALVKGLHILVDGHHRVAALRTLGRTHVTAIVSPMEEAEAELAAMLANLGNGLPLKPREQSAACRKALGAYIRCRKHLKGARRLKSYREIAADLGAVVAHTTIMAWLRKDFPGVARQFRGQEEPRRGQGGLFRETSITAQDTCATAIRQARAAFAGVEGERARGEVIAEMEEALEAMKEGAPYEPYAPDF